jgi:Flp pilus assembly protein TadD
MGTTAVDPAKTQEDALAARRKALADMLARAEEAAKAKRYHEASGICQDLLEGQPDYPPALALLGAIAGHRGDMGGAIALLERAITKEPNVASWHSNLSGLYRLHYRLDEALTTARIAVKLRPDAARYHVNLGKALIDCNLREEALMAFLTALAREPQNAEAHLAIGQVLLARGDMRPGWVEYEWRNQLDQAKGMLPTMAAPAWNGMKLSNSRLLLVADQGYGDTIQFVRYVPLIADRAAEMVLGCSPDLLPLMKNIPGIKSVHTRWNEIPPHMAYCLLSSLPGVVGTELNTIPTAIPYLSVDSGDVKAWQARLDAGLGKDRMRVGLVWAGRPTHPNDSRRSVALAMLNGFAKLNNIALVSMQKVVPDRDKSTLSEFPGMLDVADALTDFGQTAALISALDLVVTVDSAAGHLAGALGKPVWVMMPTPSDWRWLLDREDSPWYPSMRMFRQPRPGDWGSVVARVTQELGRLQVVKPRRRAAAAS